MIFAFLSVYIVKKNGMKWLISYEGPQSGLLVDM